MKQFFQDKNIRFYNCFIKKCEAMHLMFLMSFFSRKSTRTAIAQLIATIAKHDLPTNAWPQLFQFISLHVKSDNPAHREVGYGFCLLVTCRL